MQSTAIENKHFAYRPDIDGLRAIAVLAVVGFHVSRSQIRGGFVGVDIFFVISGFLISSIIYEKLRQNTFSIVDFYIRRIRRIYPALLIILFSTSVAGWYLLFPSSYVRVGEQIAGGSAFVANFVLWSQVDYLVGPVELKPLLHLWSLGVEEQFYLVFPIVCLLFYRTSHRTPLPLIFLIIALASLVANVSITGFDQSAAFYLPFTRMWELFIGAGLSLYQHHDRARDVTPLSVQLLGTFVGTVGAAMILGSIIFIDRNDAFPGWWAVPPCLGTAFVIWAGPASWINRNVLASKPAVFLGLISYPLYLWHWPILSFVRIANGYDEGRTPTNVKVAVVLISILLAFLTFQFVEKPARKLISGPRRFKLALGLVASVSLVGAFGVAISASDGFPNRVAPQVAKLDHDFDLAQIYREGSCFLRENQSANQFSQMCAGLADGSFSKPLLVLWGDSHAADLYPGFDAMQKSGPLRIAQYTASLCPPVIEYDVKERPHCRSTNDAVFAKIKALKPKIVVLSALWPTFSKHSDQAEDNEKFLFKLQKTIRSLKTIGTPRVVVVGPAPMWKRPVPSILMDEVRAYPGHPVSFKLPKNLLTNSDSDELRELTEKTGAIYVSLMSSLCDYQKCLVTTGQSWSDLLVWDTAHFTQLGSNIVVNRIGKSVIGSDESGATILN